MLLLIARLFSRKLARHENRRLAQIKKQFNLKIEQTVRTRDEVNAKALQVLKDSHAKDIEELNTSMAEKVASAKDEKNTEIENLRVEKNEEIVKLQNDLENMKQEAEAIRAEGLSKLYALQKKYDDQDKKRVLELEKLKATLNSEIEKARDIRVSWEESLNYVKAKLVDIITRLNANSIWVDEILKRIAQGGAALDQFQRLVEDLREHEDRIHRTRGVIEEPEIQIPPTEYILKETDK